MRSAGVVRILFPSTLAFLTPVAYKDMIPVVVHTDSGKVRTTPPVSTATGPTLSVVDSEGLAAAGCLGGGVTGAGYGAFIPIIGETGFSEGAGFVAGCVWGAVYGPWAAVDFGRPSDSEKVVAANSCVDTGKICVPLGQWYAFWCTGVVLAAAGAGYFRYLMWRAQSLQDREAARAHATPWDADRWRRFRSVSLAAVLSCSIVGAMVGAVLARSAWAALDIFAAVWLVALVVLTVVRDWWLLRPWAGRRDGRARERR